MQKVGAFAGQMTAGFGLHRVREGEEFGVEMVDAVLGVFWSASFAEGVVGMVESGAEVPAKHEAAAQAHRAECIESVGVLEDFRLPGFAGNACGETVGSNSVVNGIEVHFGVIDLAKEFDCVVGRYGRGSIAIRRVFGNVNAVVQVGSGEKDVESESFGFGEVSGVQHDPFDVEGVMGGIAFGLLGEIVAEGFDPKGFISHGIEKNGVWEKVARILLNSASSFVSEWYLKKRLFAPKFTRPGHGSESRVFFAMSQPIVIPENAPFNAEQRAWLSEFLTKALAGQTVSVEPAGPAVPVTILWGSQTGNSEGVAKKFMKVLKSGNYEPEVFDMAVYDKERLPKEKNLLVITSTYGDGEPPDNAADLHEYLMGDGVPSLEGVNFSVFALGDSEYPDFCQCGIEFDQRLEAFGAHRMFKRIDCDVDYDDEFAEWKNGVIAAMGGMQEATPTMEAQEEEAYGKKNPFPSPVLNSYDLNGVGSVRETYHIELSLEGSGLKYEVGDALGVLSHNPAQVVDEILPLLPFNVKEEVPLPNGATASLREALITSYDIRNLNKKLLQAWSERSGSPFLRALVEAGSREEIEDFCWGRELIDLIIDHPADFGDGEEFVGVLKKLQPRLYSIASSPKAHPNEVHLTVAIVRYNSHGRDRGGVCSTYLADRVSDVSAGVFVHNNKAFRLPEDLSKDIIMVGPGTGVAPFRAFLEEREATEASGRNWLFFGNPYRSTDFIYEEQINGWVDNKTLDRLDLAFSRDQDHKIYVQDKMLEAGEEIWSWLQGGGYFYVCGDASHMAKDVDKALHTIAQTHGGMSEEKAVNYFKELKKEKRYARDVY